MAYGDLEIGTLGWAQHLCPSGYERLAKFVGAPTDDPETVLLSCEKCRLNQDLAPVPSKVPKDK